MKSKYEQLEKRGFLPKKFNIDNYNLTFDEKLNLLESKIPTERTLTARLLKNEINTGNAVENLIKTLAKEKKLYPKIEISTALISYGELSVKPLIQALGSIGSNQHRGVPIKEFKKDSYPLPRDIASRILAHIGKIALPELLSNLEILDIKQQAEAIDAIGFICFYEYSFEAYEILQKCYIKNSNSELIQWKIIRAFSAFSESKNFLEMEKSNHQNERIKLEIERSISLIRKRKQK